MSWRYIASSVSGTSHVEQGTPCQDASIARLIRDDLLLLVASDGAGSATLSDKGSKLTCDTVLEEVTSYAASGGGVSGIDEVVVNSWLDAIIHRLHLQATVTDSPVRELACTLVAAVLDSEASAYIQVGDGGIVALEGDVYAPVTWPVGGDYANTTYFLTDDRGLERLQLLLKRPPTAEVAVFTDGLQMLALQFDSRRAHAPFFAPMFDRLRHEQPGDSILLGHALDEFLSSPAVNKRTDDDKTLILAARAPLSLGSEGQDKMRTTGAVAKFDA